jgi:glycosyltransferase involved in cell wall biosynthesis
MVKLACCLMVKDEEARIRASLDSVCDWVDSIVVLDTGSRDKTEAVTREWCKTHNKPLYYKSQTFPDPFHFGNARNVLLEFADDKADYLLLLDSNDELRGGDYLRRFVDEYRGDVSGFRLRQEWKSGVELDVFYNVRLVKTGNGWRYHNPIHEYIMSPNVKNGVIDIANGISIYQDRDLDNMKSVPRYIRDEAILQAEYRKNPDNPDPRNLFYYAQTLFCLGKNEASYKLYRQRSEMSVGMEEEKYVSLYRCGENSEKLGYDWDVTQMWYLRAYDYSAKIFNAPRAEPLFRIGVNYMMRNQWEMAYLFLSRCCGLNLPDNVLLWVDHNIYNYSRWHVTGYVCTHLKTAREAGKIACMKAYLWGKNDIDRQNLLHFTSSAEERDSLIAMIDKSREPATKSEKEMETEEKSKEKIRPNYKLESMRLSRKR